MNWSQTRNTNNQINSLHWAKWILVSLLLLVLHGCGNSVSNGEDPSFSIALDTGDPSTLQADEDLFYRTLYPVLRAYCSDCHIPGGNGTGAFAQSNIVNAFNAVVSRVNLTDPASSRIVTQVEGGHHCWDPDPTDNDDSVNCTTSAEALTDAITNWANINDPVAEQIANNSDADTTDQVDVDILSLLESPDSITPVAEQIVLGNVSPPATELADQAGYNTWVYGPIISQHCQECHSEDANQAQRQQPYFADTDLTVAFNAIVDNRKIDINNPDNSRVYLRLVQDSHNCWTDCATDAATMLTAISNWKNAVITNGSYQPPQIDGNDNSGNPVTPYSQGLQLTQGQLISGGDRYRRNLVALWEFKEGSGNRVADTSGVIPALDLVLEGDERTDPDDPVYDYAWVGGYGIEFNGGGGRARATSTEASQKIFDLIAPRNEYTLEAWVVPDNVAQEGPAVIASYSAGNANRNFTMGQTLYSYEFLNRNTNAGSEAANGQPTLITNPDDEDLQATQQHVVMTYDSVNGRRIYVNGQLTGDVDQSPGGSLNNWNDGYLFVLGAETDGTTNPWKGKIRLFAIYSSALTQDQVTQNFEAGVGQKFNLLFKVGHLTAEMPDESYVWFEVAEFDSYAYLFANPRFVVLGDRAGLPAINSTISGIRIGVNGIEAPVGQVFANLSQNINMTFDTEGNPTPTYVDLLTYEDAIVDGQTVSVPTSASGTVISKINGPNGTPPDQFYLLFNTLGDQNGAITPPVPADPLAYNYDPPVAGLADNTYVSGIKMFEEINASMSELTGIDMNNTTVRNIFLEIEQALPGSVAIEGFLASHQIAIARLALGYCGELVDNTTLRDAYFPGFPFNQAVANAFDTVAEQDIIVNALYDNMIIDNVASQPTRTETRDLLFATGSGLLDRMADNCAADVNCTPDVNRTQAVVKSMCVTVLSSAAVTVQ